MAVEIKVGGMRFLARLETERAPRSCARFRSMLPLTGRLIQARWSGLWKGAREITFTEIS